MKIQEALLHIGDVLRKTGSQLSKDERNALLDVISLVRHEFGLADDIRSLIDTEICTIRWMEKDIEEVSREAGIYLSQGVGTLIHQPGFARRLKDSCESTGMEYIITEAKMQEAIENGDDEFLPLVEEPPIV